MTNQEEASELIQKIRCIFFGFFLAMGLSVLIQGYLEASLYWFCALLWVTHRMAAKSLKNQSRTHLGHNKVNPKKVQEATDPLGVCFVFSCS